MTKKCWWDNGDLAETSWRSKEGNNNKNIVKITPKWRMTISTPSPANWHAYSPSQTYETNSMVNRHDSKLWEEDDDPKSVYSCLWLQRNRESYSHAYVEMYIHFNARIFQLRNYDWNSTSAGYTIFTGNLTY